MLDLGTIAAKRASLVSPSWENSEHNDLGPGSLDEMRDGLLRVEIVDGGIQRSHSMGEISRPSMADWLADQLVGRLPRPI